MKECCRCHQVKTLRNFRQAHSKNGKLYRASYCYDCHREYMKLWRNGGLYMPTPLNVEEPAHHNP